MAYQIPSHCPVCSHQLAVSHMHCTQCGTELRGSFSLCRFCALPEGHRQVVETYLRCRGNMKELEKALGVSYPTARAALDAALEAMGFGEKPAEEEREPDEALTALENGEIDVKKAIEQIKKRRK